MTPAKDATPGRDPWSEADHVRWRKNVGHCPFFGRLLEWEFSEV